MSSPLQKISSAQKRRTRRLRMKMRGRLSQTSQTSTSTLKMSTSPTSTSRTSISTSPSLTLTPSPRLQTPDRKTMTTTPSPSMNHPPSPRSPSFSSSTSVATVDSQQDGNTTRDTLSNFDLEIDMLASRAFARDGTGRQAPKTISPPPGLEHPSRSVDVSQLLEALPPLPSSPTLQITPPRIIIDDYLDEVDDVSLSSSRSRSLSHQSHESPQSLRDLRAGTRLSQSRSVSRSSIDDHYELVVMPQLEIILDAVRSMQCEVTHLHNEVLDLKVTTRHSLKKIWEYLNYSI